MSNKREQRRHQQDLSSRKFLFYKLYYSVTTLDAVHDMMTRCLLLIIEAINILATFLPSDETRKQLPSFVSNNMTAFVISYIFQKAIPNFPLSIHERGVSTRDAKAWQLTGLGVSLIHCVSAMVHTPHSKGF